MAESTEKVDESRQGLALAHQQRAQAKTRLEVASQAVDRALSVETAAQGDVTERERELEAEKSAAAASAAKLIVVGAQPKLAESRKALAIREALHRARSELQTANAAAKVVADDKLAAQRAVSEAEHGVELAIIGVWASDGREEAVQLEAARATVSRLEGKLQALANLPIGALGSALRPVVAVLHKITPQYTGDMDLQSQTLRRLVVYRDTLRTDATARWEDISEPARHPSPPRVVFRPSFEPRDQAAA